MLTPQEMMINAVTALIDDIAGVRQDNFADQMLMLAYGEVSYVPEEYRELVDNTNLNERIARALFDLDTMGRDENDFLFFMTSIQTPFQAQLAIHNKGLNVDEFIEQLFSKRDKPIEDLDTAEFIAFQYGNESPKYLEALGYMVNSDDERVNEAYREALKNDLDEFALSMGIKMKTDKDGETIYDIDDMVRQAQENFNATQ